MTRPAIRLVSQPRLHQMADRIYLASIQFSGFPATDDDASALAKEAYRAAAILLKEGEKYEPANGWKP